MSQRKPPTMQDVADKVGVSPMTVSRALRDGTSVNVQTREAIHRAIEELGYVFDATAANLRNQRTGFVAVTIPSINNANFADTVRALADGLRPSSLQLLLGYTDYDLDREEALVESLLRRRPEAMVVTGGKHTARCRRLLQESGIPIVEIWDLPSEPLGHVVGFSNAAAAALLVDHMVATGRSRIAFIGGDAGGDSRGTERRQGFIGAMQRHGLDAAQLVAAGPAPISMREGASAMLRLLQSSPSVEAVICVSDLAAFGALTECLRQGIAVPEQVAIAGFGDYDLAAISVPPITTIDPFAKLIGAEAAAIIVASLSAKGPSPFKVLAITPELRMRHSTSPTHEGP